MKYKDLYEDKQYTSPNFPIEIHRLDSQSPDYYISAHWHDEFEIMRVISGQLNLYINNDLYVLNAGDIAFVNCTNVHRTEPNNCKYEYIILDLQILRSKFNNLYQKYILPLQNGKLSTVNIIPAGKTNINSAINNLFNTLTAENEFYELNVLSTLFGLFELLFKNGLISENTVTKKDIKQSAVVSNLMRWIDEKYTDTITLTILAEKAQLNKNYICKIFKESTGKTPIEYVNEIRIKNICLELQNGTKSIAQIAADNGYKDMSYFCKVFKKHTGITAKKYAGKFGVE